ncbi:MAG: hypothetical protein ACPIOQ_00580 [Promethearchaeia archaeon]
MYDQDARAFAVALYLDHGFSYDEISFLFRDSRKFMGDRPSGGGGLSQGPAASTIMEWVHRFLDNGDINPSDANADGSPVFTEAELQALEGMIDADCTMMLDELVYHMYFRTGKYVDISTMCRELARRGYTNRNARERMLRGPDFAAGLGRQEQAFVAFQKQHFASEMVFFDASAAVERKLNRRRGWGYRGDDLYTYVPEVLRRGNRYTLAATMTANGRGLTAVCQGSLNREKFLDFMRRLLPGMNPAVARNECLVPFQLLHKICTLCEEERGLHNDLRLVGTAHPERLARLLPSLRVLVMTHHDANVERVQRLQHHLTKLRVLCFFTVTVVVQLCKELPHESLVVLLCAKQETPQRHQDRAAQIGRDVAQAVAKLVLLLFALILFTLRSCAVTASERVGTQALAIKVILGALGATQLALLRPLRTGLERLLEHFGQFLEDLELAGRAARIEIRKSLVDGTHQLEGLLPGHGIIEANAVDAQTVQFLVHGFRCGRHGCFHTACPLLLFRCGRATRAPCRP